jgi:hypothetical protein
MSFKIVNGVLAADVANGATFTTGYPNNANIGTFTGGVAHVLQVGQNTVLTASDDHRLSVVRRFADYAHESQRLHASCWLCLHSPARNPRG